MNEIQSMESAARMSVLDKSTESVILDFKTYFKESCDQLKSCEKLQDDILEDENMFATTIKAYKRKYMQSKEDEAVEIKSSFGSKVREFFAKVWATIVSIFQKIILVVISLIKTVIVFIQKKRLSNSVIVKKCEDTIKKLSGTDKDIELNNIINDLVKVRVNTYITKDKHTWQTFDDVHNAINNKDLKSFIDNDRVILNNNKSLFNLNLLDEILKSSISTKMILRTVESGADLSNGVSYNSEDKLTELNVEVTALTNTAILQNEVTNDMRESGVHNPFINSWIAKVYSGTVNADNDVEFSLAEGDNVRKLANYIVYSTTDSFVHFSKVKGIEFIGVKPDDIQTNRDFIIKRIMLACKQYITDYNIICGSNGYIDNINKTLEAYKNVAKNDSAKIKEIKKYIDDQLNEIQKEETKPQNTDDYIDKKDSTGKTIRISKVDILKGQIKKFTMIMTKVNNVKTKFVALRQYLIGNLISLLSMEEKIIRVVAHSIDKNDLENETGNRIVNISESPIHTVDTSKDYHDLLVEGDESLTDNIKDGLHHVEDKIDHDIAPKLGEKIDNVDAKLDIMADTLATNTEKAIDYIGDLVVSKAPKSDDDDSEDEDDDNSEFSDDGEYNFDESDDDIE